MPVVCAVGVGLGACGADAERLNADCMFDRGAGVGAGAVGF